jgi:hypothetical protein
MARRRADEEADGRRTVPDRAQPFDTSFSTVVKRREKCS